MAKIAVLCSSQANGGQYGVNLLSSKFGYYFARCA